MVNLKIPRVTAIIIGVILSIVLIFAAFALISNVFTKAADVQPRDVVVSSITQNSATVAWSTGEKSQGVLEYGTSPTALNSFSQESDSKISHSQDLTLLAPTTTYYFDIKVGDNKYDNGGVPWTFTTKGPVVPTVPPTPTPAPTTVTPTPVSTVNIPNNTTSTCPVTNCVSICQKLGTGCSTQDLKKNNCLGKVNISDCVANTPTPTR